MDQTANSQNRVNLLAFPSETKVLFNLFLVAALMSSVNIAIFIYTFSVHGQTSVPHSVTQPKSATTQGLQRNRWTELIDGGQKALTAFLALAAVPLGVLVCGTVLYWLHPTLIRRRHHLRVLTPAQDPRLYDQLLQLVRTAAIHPVPTFEISEDLSRLDAQAFGAGSSLRVRLEGGLRLLCRKKPEMFRARVLHELGHIANGDVPRSYFSEACWKSFIWITIGLVAVLVPTETVFQSHVGAASWTSVAETSARLLWIGVQIAAAVLVVAAIRAALLRNRELYADARAASFGAATTLTEMFRRSPPPNPRWLRLRRFWRLHPSSRERFAALSEPERLCRIGSGLPMLMGTLLAFCSPGLFVISLLVFSVIISFTFGLTGPRIHLGPEFDQMSPDAQFAALFWAATAILSMIVAIGSILIVMTWIASQLTKSFALPIYRMVVARLLSGNRALARYTTLWKAALLLAVGLELGFALAPLSPAPDPNVPSLAYGIFYVPITAILTGLCLSYLRFFSKRILERHTGDSFPVGKIRALVISATFLFTISLGGILLSRTPSLMSDQSMFALLAWPMIFSLFLFPLIFVLSFVVLGIGRMVMRMRCPACSASVVAPVVLGQLCVACREPLATWPFTPDSFLPKGLRLAVDPRRQLGMTPTLPLTRKSSRVSLILGVACLALSPWPCAWPVSVPASFAAIIVGHRTVRKANRGEVGGRTAAIWGLSCGYLALIVAFLFVFVWAGYGLLIKE